MGDVLRTLLAGVIDYAGLFPPAQLPLDDAIRRYAQYRRGPDAWMLGRFVIPAARLAELDPYVGELFATGPPLALAVLGRPAERVADWTTGLRPDADAIARCRQAHGDRVSIDVVEARLPQETLESDVTERVVACVRTAGDVLGHLPAFYEAGPAAADRANVAAVLAALARTGAGYKLRCGGTTAAAFPPAEPIAYTLHLCHETRVPLKLTAGLHHPLPRFNAGLKASMHGFINVFAAGVFAATGADENTLKTLLADAEPGHFGFDAALRWKDRTAAAAQVAAVRRQAVLSFGSCSFDEPRDDLRALGWL
jgi:hypothetical protein